MLENERQRIAQLIVQKVKGRINTPDRQELEAWAALSADNRHLLDRFLDERMLLRELLEYEELNGDAIWADLVAKIPALGIVNRTPPAGKNWWQRWREELHWKHRQFEWVWGFSIVAIIGIAVLLLRDTPKPGAPEKPFPPGQFKLLITLPNGATLDAGAIHEGDSTRHNNITIHKTQEGTIVYRSDAPGDGAVLKDSTPRGGWYTIVLPDNSKVYLNAASSLSFSNTFGRRERNVFLKGEGYFEVAAQDTLSQEKIPFVVQVQRAGVTKIFAFGTDFNVTAYGDDPFIKTTLLRGTVHVEDPERAVPIELQPGEQYVQYEHGRHSQSKLQDADMEAAVAWRNDEFIFNDEPVTNIMRQISRWYDVPVEYKDTTTIRLTTAGSRKDSLRTVLHRLDGIDNVHFKIEDHHIVVFR